MAVKLEKWYFRFHKGMPIAWGICIGHPKHQDGTSVHTSTVLEAWVEDGQHTLHMRTESGSHYALEAGDADIGSDRLGETGECLGMLGIPAGYLDEIVGLAEEKEAEMVRHADSLTSEGDLYMRIAGTDVLQAYFKKDGTVCRLDIRWHVGTFQDSVLVERYGVADYRYFPKLFGMETYHISSGIRRLVVENAGTCEACLDGKVHPPGTVGEVCITGAYCKEGLFSPDCVDGKELLSEVIEWFVDIEDA